VKRSGVFHFGHCLGGTVSPVHFRPGRSVELARFRSAYDDIDTTRTKARDQVLVIQLVDQGL